MTDESLPVIDPGGEVVAERRNVAIRGLLLAAGTSDRFGEENKLLATIDGKPVVRHAAETLVHSALDGTTVVLGYEAEAVRSVLEDLPVDFVVNPDYESGQASSITVGLRTLSDADAVVIALGDMPAVSVETVDRLIETYRTGSGDALAAACGGVRGNPVLFDRKYFDQILEVRGDTGARDVLLTAERGGLVETDDPGVRRDIDEPRDIDPARDRPD